MPRKGCRQAARDLQNYLRDESHKLVKNMKRDMEDMDAGLDLDSELHEQRQLPPTNRLERTTKKSGSKCKSITKIGCVAFIVPLVLIVAYMLGIISGITGEPFPVDWIRSPQIYY